MTVSIRLKVNGRDVEAETEPRKTLADFLREDLGLTGVHLGCEQGVCGACTVLLNGRSVRSCIMFAVQAEGLAVTTIEGLASRSEELHPIQRAFAEHHGLQCGYCTPGMVLSAYNLLQENPDPSEEEIREFMSGNICRCTGYVFIVESIKAASSSVP